MERLVPWLRRSGWAYIVLAIALAGLAWRVASSRPQITQPRTAPGPVAIASRPASDVLVVHVAGAVKRPGLYRLPPEARVADALRRAGGPRQSADLTALNLAAPIADGQQVLVPARAGPGGGVGGGSSPAVGGGPVSLSSATAEQLDALDGIGPTLAARIVAWRTEHGGFSSVDQLLEVPGIGQTRLESIRERVTP